MFFLIINLQFASSSLNKYFVKCKMLRLITYDQYANSRLI